MKLSSKVLAGSLASAGMVLSLVAPALTAQAATTSGKVNDNGSVTGITGTGDTYGTADAANNGGIAIAYDDGAGKVGSASMESNANVKVVSGLLVLNAVPDFGFGSAALGSTVGLVNNTHDIAGADSTDSDAVKVTETRTEHPGFSLNAQISNFTTAGDTTGKAFTLNLKPTALTNDTGANVSSVKTSNVNLAGGDKAAASLVSLKQDDYKVGQVNAQFQPGDKNAFLTLGDDATGSDANAKDAKVTIIQ
jgi:hypothetical protein